MMPIKKKLENLDSSDIEGILISIIEKNLRNPESMLKLSPLLCNILDYNHFLRDIARCELNCLLSNSNYKLKEYIEMTLFIYSIVKWEKDEKKFVLRKKIMKSHNESDSIRKREDLCARINDYFHCQTYNDFIDMKVYEEFKNTKNYRQFSNCDKDFLKILLSMINPYVELQSELYSKLKYSSHRLKFRMSLINLWSIEICPYCNINEIVGYTKKKNEYSTGEIDHILPKSYFPLLSLSYGNFMVSCSDCNMKFKNDSIQNYVYNRKDGYAKDITFDFHKLSLDSCIKNTENIVEIKINSSTKDKIINNALEELCLIDRYNSNKSKKEICKMFREFRRIYNTGNIKHIENITGISSEKIIEKMLNYIRFDSKLDKDDVERIFDQYIAGEIVYIDESYGKCKSDILDRLLPEEWKIYTANN